ncbi:organic cation transporter protein-like [Babylonia areolata]|uniref:organic cation transporter protein-like n=1 Tax=Babylonia areolata TaxID=304850 RepID=UPI003FD304E7
MKFDELTAQLGEFGRYQKRVFFLLSPAAMTCGIQVMISVFNMGVPFHRCALPNYAEDTWRLHSEEHAALVNESIPRDPDLVEKGGYSRCNIYFQHNATSAVNIRQCSHFVYDPTVYSSSAVTQWDLVCDKKLFRTHARMVLMGGLLLGAITTGIIADIIGRKQALMAMVALHAASSIAVAWSPSFVVYLVLRCITGFTISGLFLVIFVLGMELVGPKKRMFVGIVVEMFWSCGVMLLGGVAYVVRDWTQLQMIVSFPVLLLFLYWWLIPESPRWLLARGRDEEAEAIIRHAARVNGVQLPEKVFDNKTFDEVSGQERFWHIFGSPVLIVRTAILCLNWLVCSMVFYGLSLNSGNLGGSVYINFQLMAVVEVIAYLGCVMLLNRLGRKVVHIACMMLGGGACLSTILAVLYASAEVQVWLTILLALLGKLGAAAAFAIIYVYSAELFPTLLRNSLMGLTCLFARLGGMISPYIADLNDLVGGQFGQALPLLVFGSATVGAGFLCLLLPETLHKHLPETLEDAKMFGRKERRNRRRHGTLDLEFKVDAPDGTADAEREPFTSVRIENSASNNNIYKPNGGASPIRGMCEETVTRSTKI